VKSPQLAPLSPPPFDPEVERLEEEVRVASERIQQLRVEMQAAIEEKVKEKILAKLPSAGTGQEQDDAGEAGYNVDMPPLPKGVDAEVLKQKLADAAAKMPGLKAKLEDVHEKMVKIIDSVEVEGVRDAGEAPNTAERALRRLYDEPQSLDDTMDLKNMVQKKL
jgi:predicted  nucleic acid-binding Zn-ribbon protein